MSSLCRVHPSLRHHWRYFGRLTARSQSCQHNEKNRCIRSYSHSSLSGKTVRIGCASGFWGDTATSAPQLIHKGKIDYLVFDYLSEITMSLMTAAKQKVPDMGYAPDFVQMAVGPYLKDIKKKGLRVISNAGGINPQSCVAALTAAAKKADVDLKIAVVTGDDLISQKQSLINAGVTEMYSGIALPETVSSMTAYLGAGPIAQALARDADIVITGRCTDSALVLAPLLHEFKWDPSNFDMLASGSLAGHLIECGAQVTGGVFTDWHKVPDWHNIGFPIVECSADGRFVVSKPPGTGGLVSTATVAEQLVYEIGDPQSYILPDVVCDFSGVNLEQLNGDEVLVTGVRGKAPTNTYKVSATYADGYRLTAVCPLGGPRAGAKGRKTAEAIIKRTRGIFKQLGLADYSKVNIQILGAEDTYGEHATKGDGPREAVVWLSAHHQEKKALQLMSMEIAPAGTGMAPGLMTIAGGRPKVSPVLKLFSFLYPKDKCDIQIHLDGQSETYKGSDVATCDYTSIHGSQSQPETTDLPKGSYSYRLEDLAFTRSGDKGNDCNIGVIARDPSYLPYLRKALTPESVDKYMRHVFEDHSGNVETRVVRYDLPGIHGMNFVLRHSLGGGGIASLRCDPQGKAFAQMLLDFPITDVPELVK